MKHDKRYSLPKLVTVEEHGKITSQFSNFNIYITLESQDGISVQITPSFYKEGAKKALAKRREIVVVKEVKPEDDPFYEYKQRIKNMPNQIKNNHFILLNKRLQNESKVKSVTEWEIVQKQVLEKKKVLEESK